MQCKLLLDGGYIHNRTRCVHQEEIVLKDATKKNVYDQTIASDISAIENAWYKISAALYGFEDVESLELYLNDKLIAECRELHPIIAFDDALETYSLYTFDPGISSGWQPFLLQYDILRFSVHIHTKEGDYSFESDHIVCLSKNLADYNNVKNIIEEILIFGDDMVNDWVFNVHSQDEYDFGVLESAYKQNTKRSISAYIQMLKDIVSVYHKNVSLFKHHAKHSIKCEIKTLPFEKVRNVSIQEFGWLMQNADHLKEIKEKTAIQYRRKNYLPDEIQTSYANKSLNVYENQVTISFLKTVIINLKSVLKKYEAGLINEEETIRIIQGCEKSELKSPILISLRYQVAFGRKNIEELSTIKSDLEKLFVYYSSMLPCDFIEFNRIPRKTKVFQEILHYSQIYNLLLKWFRYGEFSLDKENLLLRIKKIDKIFEYYCLLRLLKMFKDKGFVPLNPDQPSTYYKYKAPDARYIPDYDVANTYILTDHKIDVTIYYQPVIYTNDVKNDISLFRTNAIRNYFIPDFLVKVVDKRNFIEQNGIFDAKYSTRENILKRRTDKEKSYLDEEILDYICSIGSTKDKYIPVKMMWLLQGRIDDAEQVYHYHCSPMAMSYPSVPSIGVFSLNSENKDTNLFWNEIKRHIIT